MIKIKGNFNSFEISYMAFLLLNNILHANDKNKRLFHL